MTTPENDMPPYLRDAIEAATKGDQQFDRDRTPVQMQLSEDAANSLVWDMMHLFPLQYNFEEDASDADKKHAMSVDRDRIRRIPNGPELFSAYRKIKKAEKNKRIKSAGGFSLAVSFNALEVDALNGHLIQTLEEKRKVGGSLLMHAFAFWNLNEEFKRAGGEERLSYQQHFPRYRSMLNF